MIHPTNLFRRPEEFTRHMPVCAAARQKALAERASHTEKKDRENVARLPAVPTAASSAKQCRKRKTKLEKATNEKEISKIRANMCGFPTVALA